MVTIATFDTIVEAHIAMGRLQTEGIQCWLADQHLVQTDWLYSPAIGGIKLQVDDNFAAQARKIINTDYSGDIPTEDDD